MLHVGWADDSTRNWMFSQWESLIAIRYEVLSTDSRGDSGERREEAIHGRGTSNPD